MKKIKVSVILILIILGILPVNAAKINAVRVGSKINVTIDGKYFTSYIFSSDEKYPFFYPVNGPLSGGSVTSLRNGEYPHHSSLFFGCDKVNEGNYWQEGLERGRIISVNAEILKEGGDTVVISDECIWSRPGALSPVKDRRIFVITSPSATVRQIDVTISMEMLMDVHILKTNHSLFSARMAADLSVKTVGRWSMPKVSKVKRRPLENPRPGLTFMERGETPSRDWPFCNTHRIHGTLHHGSPGITDLSRLPRCTGHKTERRPL